MQDEGKNRSAEAASGSKFASYAPFLLVGILVVAIAVATVVEDVYGTAVAHHYFYASFWFKLLWLLLAATGSYLIFLRRLWRRLPVFLLHLSFVVILSGALLTSLTSKKGVLHLRQGVPQTEFVRQGRSTVEQLPFYVRLDSFQIHYYPGTEAPQDYVSHLTIEGQQHVISMNHIVRRSGYRLYQSSFDEDRQGSILSVNYDPWGTTLTYIGYAMLGLSMMAVLLLRPKRRKAAAALLLLLLCQPAKALPVVSTEKAAELEREQVMWNNRVAPLGTMSQEFLLKVYGKRRYHGLTPTQVVASMVLEPTAWTDEPIIKVRRGKYVALSEFLDQTGQVPTLRNVGNDPKTDEKVGLMLMLSHGTLVKAVPENVQPLPEKRLSAELFYNHVDWLLWGMMACFVLAALSAAVQWQRGRRVLKPAVAVLHCGLFLFLLSGWLLRWYVAQFLPLSNGYETMFFVAICLLAVPFVARRTLPVAALAAAFVLLVAHLGEVNPHITPLMPVLHSPWLSAHVSIIMMSYALLIISFVERRLLRLAVFLLAAGIFLGAVWANVSWGSYWSWDPKESWALLTLLVYSIPLHSESLPWFRSTRHYRLYSIFSLLCLLMTYFGVNYLLGGMHSYGG